MALRLLYLSSLALFCCHVLAASLTDVKAPFDSLPPLISLEDHYTSNAIRESTHGKMLGLKYVSNDTISKLENIGADRISDLDSGGINIQVIAHSPVAHVPDADLCKKANDELAAAVQNHPRRYAGFALLPVTNVSGAVDEFHRAVKDLGFLGAMIPSHANNRYYDDAFFWPVFAKAQELDVPIYIHPGFAIGEQRKMFSGNYSHQMATTLGAQGYAWHVETGLSFLRLWAGGIFDKYPNLKIILGHDGEGIPFWLARSSNILDPISNLSRDLVQVWKQNVWVTTSGQFTEAPFAAVIGTTDASRIMYSVDYPYASNEDGASFMNDLSQSGLLTSEQFKGVAYKNAEKLLGISVNAGKQ